MGEASDVVQAGGCLHNFDESVALQGAGFFAGDDRGVDAAGLDDRESEGVLCLGGGEAERTLQGAFPERVINHPDAGGLHDAIQHHAELLRVGEAEVNVGKLVLEFGRELQAAAQQDEGVAVGLGDPQDVLDAAYEHRVALVEVELQVPQEHDMARGVGGEHPVEELEGFQWVGAGGDASFAGVDEALGGGPGVQVVIEVGAGGGDFGFGPRLLGGDDGQSGVTGTEVGGEVHGNGGGGLLVGYQGDGIAWGWRFCCSQCRQLVREECEKSTAPVSASCTSHCWVAGLKRMSVARTTRSRPSARRSIASV